MKKWFLLMCVCAFVGNVVSAGSWLVYDYKASIKRLDYKIANTKYSLSTPDGTSGLVTSALESYTTASDSLKGFLLLAMCEACGVYNGSDVSLPFDEAYLYLMRGADKTKNVWKFEAEVSSSLFGVGAYPESEILEQNTDGPQPGSPTSYKKLTQAGMLVGFELGDCFIPETGAQFGNWGTFPYGFLGHGSESGDVAAAGFGKAQTLTKSSFCNPTASCFQVTSINGNLVAQVFQKGVCGRPPLWDVCTLEAVVESVMSGTWSVKLNNKLTDSFNAGAGNQNAADEITIIGDNYLRTKLGGTGLIDGNCSK